MVPTTGVTLLGPLACRGCRRPSKEMLCKRCAATRARPDAGALPSGIDGVLAPWAYDDAVRSLILELKLRGRRAAACPLARAMVVEGRRLGLRAEALTWVPGRGRDVRRRGYDHARELARLCSGALGIPARPLLTRTRDPADQTTLGAEDRRRNLLGAFAATTCPSHVALVDDLVTTGATAEACARALRGAGATHIELLVPARA